MLPLYSFRPEVIILDKMSYLAALLDGEGSIGFYSKGVGKGKRFQMEIKMTDEGVINWLLENFGGYKYYRRGKGTHKDQWRWRVQGNFAYDLYNDVESLLKIKRLGNGT